MSDSAAQPTTFSSGLSKTFPPEDLLPALLNVSLTGVILFEPVYQAGTGEIIDLTYVMLNAAAQRMLQLPERPTKTFLQLYPHAQETGVFAFHRNTFVSGEPGRYDVHYQHDGLNNYFQLAAQRCGQGLVVNFTDKASQTRTAIEEALRESQTREQAARAEADLQRQQLHNAFMQAPALICIFEGPQHVFKLVNPSYQQLVGERPLLGKPIAEAMPELAGQPIFGLLDKVYRTGETFQAHEMLVQLDHDNAGGDLGQNYYNFIYQAMRNLAGDIDGILVFAYEVTVQVQARRQVEYSHQQVQVLNEELQVTNEELQATNEEFLTNYAELLRTQQALQQLNEELEARVAARTREVQHAQAATEQQRARLERFFMQAPAAICIYDGPELVYELVNPGYQQMFPGRQLLGKPILEALPELTSHPVLHTLQQVYQTGETHEEYGLLIPVARYENAPLEDIYFNYILQARFDEHGGIDGLLVFAFEVTEQVEARKEADRQRQMLHNLFMEAPSPIVILDGPELVYQLVNPAYQQIFPGRSLLGKALLEALPELEDTPIPTILGQVYRTGETFVAQEMSLKVARHQGGPLEEIYCTFTYQARRNGQGTVDGIMAFVYEVTEQVKARRVIEESEQQAQALAKELATANEELRVANQQLTRTNVDLDNFIYTASHDLKAPILNIEGLMEALMDQLPPESLQQAPLQRTTDLILDSVQRFKRTIDHLTEITKLQKENSLEATPINLAAVIEEVQLDLALDTQATQAELAIDVTSCPTIRFSEKNLRSIIYNLLSNAIKYHSPERPPLVRVHCYETTGYQVLSVQDNGLGMDLAQEHKLFAMFQRLHNHVEGSGIGLYMVKKIIDNAGGKIEVQSKVGEGSTFRVYFRRNF